jgi:hypothetical protein
MESNSGEKWQSLDWLKSEAGPPTQNQNNSAVVEQLVLSRAPFGQWRRFFRHVRQCANYFAEGNGNAFRPEATIGPCVVCGCRSSAVVRYRWQARFFDRLNFGGLSLLALIAGHLHASAKYQLVEFSTFHPVCEGCARTLRARRWIANILNFIGFFMLIVGILIAAIGWSCYFYFDGADRRGGLITGITATAGVFVASVCLLVLKALRVPQALRFLPTGRFSYCSAKRLSGVPVEDRR